MNLPNTITLGRLVSTSACIVLLEVEPDPAHASPVLIWWAFVIFVVSAATDFVDGWLARRFGQVTPFGLCPGVLNGLVALGRGGVLKF